MSAYAVLSRPTELITLPATMTEERTAANVVIYLLRGRFRVRLQKDYPL